jgi:hypothetical protein
MPDDAFPADEIGASPLRCPLACERNTPDACACGTAQVLDCIDVRLAAMARGLDAIIRNPPHPERRGSPHGGEGLEPDRDGRFRSVDSLASFTRSFVL